MTAQTRPALLAAFAGLALAAAPASAQNALGDGRALDANPSVQGRGNLTRPSFSQELQFRNAIATGNAPGGLSFRGDLGYRAVGEFTGDLGSDELFAFRRDSLASGLAGMGIRGTDALQYQFSLTTGARPPQNLMGSFTYTRDNQYQTGAEYTGVNPRQVPISTDPNFVDPRGLNLYQPSAQEADLADALSGSLRSSASYTSTTNLSPVILSSYQQGFDQRLYGLTSSVLTGVTSVPMRDNASQRDREALPDNQQPGAVQGLPRDPTATRTRTAYEEVVERIRARAAEEAERTQRPEQDEIRDSIDRLDAVRRSMMGTDIPTQADLNRPETQPETRPESTTPNTRPGTPDESLRRPNVPVNPADPRATPEEPQAARTSGPTPTQPGTYAIDPRTLELIRGDSTPLTSLLAPDAESRDLFSEHMRAGERLITAERYFDAEERFARALSLRPGDPTAQIGRAHAQLGAGLLLSASVNIRSILVNHPELLATRYAGRLLPAPDRIDMLIVNLQERAGLVDVPGRADEEPGTRVAAGMLLAYLGYQNSRPEIIESGLSVMDKVGSNEDTRLTRVLRQVWLDSPGAPAPTEPEPQTAPTEDNGR